MLYIKTDLEDKEWFKYILEEFQRINLADFEIKIIDKNEVVDSKNIIYYTKDFIYKKSLINKSHILPRTNTVELSREIFIIEETDTKDNRFLINYDIFWNAFVFLSRLEEYLSANMGKKIDSYSFNHPRARKNTFYMPIVNNLFNEFEEIIKDNFPNLTFAPKGDRVIELSHDVDYINKTLQARLRQTAFNAFNTLRSVYRPRRFVKNAYKTISFFFSNPSYWCFEYWEDLEKKFDKRSVFYIFAKTKQRNFKKWFMDPFYDIANNRKLQQKLRYLIREGFEVGLHGSYESALNEQLLRREKEILSDSLNCELTKVRQHWLRYEESITPYLHEKLFKYDSTLGWNDRIGFRAGCVSRYRPYDHRNQRAFDFCEIPQIIMDGNIFNYSIDAEEKMLAACLETIKNLENYKNTYVSISWHSNSCSEDYGWNGFYEKLLKQRV